VDFDTLFAAHTWMPIRNCPGRFVLTGADPGLTVAALAGEAAEAHEFHVATARDVVVVAAFGNGGLISYKRNDGTYRHTLNTVEGFARKLAQLGIDALKGTRHV
jgi:hypothetical protein